MDGIGITGRNKTCTQILSKTPEEKRSVRKRLHRQKATLKWILKKEGVRVENGLTCLTLGTNETGYCEQGNKRLKQGCTNPGCQVAVATKFRMVAHNICGVLSMELAPCQLSDAYKF